MPSNTEIVLEFLRACNGRDVAGLTRFFTEDCFYHNIPIDPLHGPDAVVAVLTEFAKISEVWEFKIHHIAESKDGVVLTERTDLIQDFAGNWHEFPTMGAFEIRDGRISAWRDYYDQTIAMATVGRAAEASAGKGQP